MREKSNQHFLDRSGVSSCESRSSADDRYGSLIFANSSPQTPESQQVKRRILREGDKNNPGVELWTGVDFKRFQNFIFCCVLRGELFARTERRNIIGEKHFMAIKEMYRDTTVLNCEAYPIAVSHSPNDDEYKSWAFLPYSTKLFNHHGVLFRGGGFQFQVYASSHAKPLAVLLGRANKHGEIPIIVDHFKNTGPYKSSTGRLLDIVKKHPPEAIIGRRTKVGISISRNPRGNEPKLMMVYRFLDKKAALNTIETRRLRISRIDRLNDPFEFLAANLSDKRIREAFMHVKKALSLTKGIICFSENWENPVLWAHYADKYRGICLKFEVTTEEELGKINYIQDRIECDEHITEEQMQATLYSKFEHWRYEDEWRLFRELKDRDEEGNYYVPFSDQIQLKTVLVGSESDVTRDQLTKSLGELSECVKRFQVRPAFREFKVTENLNGSLWR